MGKEGGAAVRNCEQEHMMWYRKKKKKYEFRGKSISWLKSAECKTAICNPVTSFLFIFPTQRVITRITRKDKG